jgi:hypothetical protein
VNLPARFEEGSKEAEPLDVIHVEVGQQHMDGTTVAGEHGFQTPHASASVEDEDGIVAAIDLDAGGVAAVSDRVRTRAGEGST